MKSIVMILFLPFRVLAGNQVSGILFSDDYDSAYFTLGGILQYAPLVSSLVTTISTAGGAAAADVWAAATGAPTRGAHA